MVTFLLMALVLGLGGSLHCLAMCGPLVMRIPFAKNNHGLWQTILYHLGKSTAYGTLGVLFGLIGKGFTIFNWQQALSILAGIIMLLLAFMPQIQKRFSGHYLFSKQLGNVLKKMQASPVWWHFVAIGFLNGYLPCGLVYTALAGATVTAGAWQGFLFMFVFGMGTLPALSVLSFFSHSLQGQYRQRLKSVSMIFSLAIGVLLIMRGLNLNIPYISPHFFHSHAPGVECH